MRLPDRVVRGVCLAHSWQDEGADGYGSDASRQTLRHLEEIGVNTISMTPFGWMSDAGSPRIRGEHNAPLPRGGESRDRLVRMVEQAGARDMRVVLKPHIWIRGGGWRGDIAPRVDGEPAWTSWWESYRRFIRYYAKLASELDVAALVVGVELVSAIEARPEEFRATIRTARRHFEGHLTYGANWNEEVPDRIWKDLDAVGVQFYPPLAGDGSPTLERLRSAVRKELDDWSRRAERVNRPLDIVEVGYKSAASAVHRPYEWPDDLSSDRRVVDRALQRRAYRALFTELTRTPKLRSVFVWKYFTDPSRDKGGPLGFSPRGKPAEQVLRHAYGGGSDRNHVR